MKLNLEQLREKFFTGEVHLDEYIFIDAYVRSFKEISGMDNLNEDQERIVRSFANMRIRGGMDDRQFIEDPGTFVEKTYTEVIPMVLNNFKSLIQDTGKE